MSRMSILPPYYFYTRGVYTCVHDLTYTVIKFCSFFEGKNCGGSSLVLDPISRQQSQRGCRKAASSSSATGRLYSWAAS
jgi:hypothetical protein